MAKTTEYFVEEANPMDTSQNLTFPGRDELSDQVPETKNLEKIEPNDLLEEMSDVQRMDARAPAKAVRSD